MVVYVYEYRCVCEIHVCVCVMHVHVWICMSVNVLQIADLGLATCQTWSRLTKEESRRQSRLGRMGAGGGGARAAGTLCYMAPEHLDSIHTRSSEKSDIYSFAIVIWVILTAREPFESECCSLSLQRPVGVIVIVYDFSHIQWVPKVLGQWQLLLLFRLSSSTLDLKWYNNYEDKVQTVSFNLRVFSSIL